MNTDTGRKYPHFFISVHQCPSVVSAIADPPEEEIFWVAGIARVRRFWNLFYGRREFGIKKNELVLVIRYGFQGFLLSILRAYDNFLSYAKLREKEGKKK